MANNKTVICKSCNTTILKKAKICPNCGVKNKKPIYKRAWFIVVAVILVLSVLGSIGSNDTEKFQWNNFELAHLLPEPESNRGEILSDSEEILDIYVANISSDEYDSYISECKDKGFTIESEKTENSYKAFNKDGYKLSLWYDDNEKELNIGLSAPEEMGDLDWPTRGLGNILPEPYSWAGKIVRDDSDYFSAIVGETPIDDFKDYIEECEDAGFTVNYSKSEKYYSAENKDGYKVYVKYIGFDTIEITIEIINNKENEKTDIEVDNDEEKTSEKENDNQYIDGMRPEFKEAMDSYEEFMEEYVVFMKKYANSDGTDVSILSDYATYMSKYAKFVEDFEKWEDEEMNTAETAYYIQVQSRVSQKLLEIA